MKLNTLGIAHQFLAARVPEGGLCIDGTMGRGKDTAFLCQLVGPEGKVIAFDIQEEALASTDALLREKGLEGESYGPEPEDLETYKDRQYDRLAAALRASLDMEAVYRILERGL